MHQSQPFLHLAIFAKGLATSTDASAPMLSVKWRVNDDGKCLGLGGETVTVPFDLNDVIPAENDYSTPLFTGEESSLLIELNNAQNSRRTVFI